MHENKFFYRDVCNKVTYRSLLDKQNEMLVTKREPFFAEFQQQPVSYGGVIDTSYADSLYWKEQHLYGSSRLGIAKPELEVTNYKNSNFSLLTSNFKNYELTNHLGNILATIKDEKQQIDQNNDGIVDYYEPIVITANDYYPFGMLMPNRSFSLGGSNYRFGFNSQEKDDEVYGAGNLNTALFWEYDTRLGRRWNYDPKPHASISPYATFANNPILVTDVNGDTTQIFNSKGVHLGTFNDNNPMQAFVSNSKYDKTFNKLKGLDFSKLSQEKSNQLANMLTNTGAGITYDINSARQFYTNWSSAFPAKTIDGTSIEGKKISLNGKPLVKKLYAEAVLYLSLENNRIKVPNTQPQSDRDLLYNSATKGLKIHHHPNMGKNGQISIPGPMGSSTNYTLHSESGPSSEDQRNIGDRPNEERDIVVDKNNVYLYNKENVITIRR